MLLSCLILSFALFLALVIHQLIDWARNWRLARQQPSAQDETTFEEAAEKPTEEADDSTREDSHVSGTLLDPDLLDCPICCEPLKSPIFQCTNGHIACSMCSTKLESLCPSCKLPIGYHRCRAMEKFIEAFKVSCPNVKYGCKEYVLYENLSSHEEQCVFAPCSCPVPYCNYTGSYKGLKNHVTVKHKEGLIRFTWDTALNLPLREKINIFREEQDGELIVVQRFNGSDGVFVSVSCIAPLATEIGIFTCSLELRTLTLRNTLKHRLIMKTIQKMSEERPEEDFLLIPSYMLRRRFTMMICMTRKPRPYY